MPNKNNEKEIELLPEELRRKEVKKKEEKKPPEITFYVPPEEKRPEGVKVSFFEKIFGTKEEREKKRLARQKEREEREKRKAEEKAKLEALRAQKETALKAEREAKKEAEKVEAVEKMKIPEVRPEKKRIKMRELKKEAPLKPSLGITLIPEAAAPAYLSTKKQLVIVFVFVSLAFVISAMLYWAAHFYQLKIKSQNDFVLKNIESLKKEIALYEEDKKESEKVQEQLQAIKNLLTSHLYWTKFFGLLEKNTIPDVYYSNFVASSDGAVALSAIGKSFSSVAEQIVSFEEAKDFVKEVNITGASAQIDPTGAIMEVNFEVDLKLIPEVFLK